jgi:ABC-2 type transport system permease protein
MGKLWAVIKREYLERVRNKWFIIVTVFGPVFFAAIMVLPAYLSVRGIRDAKVGGIRIVDASGAGLGARVAERLATPALQGAPAPAAVPVDLVDPASLAAAESVLVADVVAKKLTGFLVIEPSTLENGHARRLLLQHAAQDRLAVEDDGHVQQERDGEAEDRRRDA